MCILFKKNTVVESFLAGDKLPFSDRSSVPSYLKIHNKFFFEKAKTTFKKIKRTI